VNFLQGKRILLTRTEAQNQQTATLVQKHGAIPVFFPCLAIHFLHGNMRVALHDLQSARNQGSDIIFSSRNGVLAMLDCVQDLKSSLQGFRLVAVGQKTADLLRQHGCVVDMIPQQASQQGLIDTYMMQTLPQQVFFFRAEQGNDDLMRFFAKNSIKAQLIPSYRSICVENNPEILDKLQQQPMAAVLLGSAKTAMFFAEKTRNIHWLSAEVAAADAPVIAVMSQQVAVAAGNVGLKVQVIANKPSFEAMLDGLNTYFSNI